MLGDATKLRFLLEPIIEELGYELVYITLSGSKRRAIQIFIDAPGGITVDDCERISRRVSDVLDIEDAFDGEYVLEVSSPGLDRPLAKEDHFKDAQGKEVFIRMRSLHYGRRKFRGSLVEVGKEGVVIEVDGGSYELLYSEMHKANLVGEIDFGVISRPRRERKQWETTRF